jgi:hypothetical protein
VVERTLSLFFQWLRAQSELTVSRKRSRRLRALRWDAAQATMRLDALTAGWFSVNANRALPLLRAPSAQAGPAASPAQASRAAQTGSPVPQQQEKRKSESPR